MWNPENYSKYGEEQAWDSMFTLYKSNKFQDKHGALTTQTNTNIHILMVLFNRTHLLFTFELQNRTLIFIKRIQHHSAGSWQVADSLHLSIFLMIYSCVGLCRQCYSVPRKQQSTVLDLLCFRTYAGNLRKRSSIFLSPISLTSSMTPSLCSMVPFAGNFP